MLRLRNTLSRPVEPVEPLEPGRVRMYTCGPTVYRYAHVGNLRSNLLADLIRRVLLYHGVEVLHVKNITDVGHLRDEGFDRGDDPMLVAAGLESKTPAEIAAAYEAAFHADEALVNILPAHVFPRATEHIPEMLDAGRARSQDAGIAYATPEGNVYYAVVGVRGLRPAVGQHARRPARRPPRRRRARQARPGGLRAVEGGRRGPAPQAGRPLAGARASRAGTSSARRWRCATSGRPFDIHTGGIDNVFPHHEDEIAQSAPIVGGVPARHWVHGEFLLMDGQKMAKSAGNFERVTELVERGIDPLAFRYLALTSRYSRKLEYSDRSLAAAAAALESLRAGLRSLGPPPADGPWAAPPVAAGRARRRPSDGRRGRGRGPRRRSSGPPLARPRATRSATAPPPLPLPCRPKVARSTIGSSRRSTTTSTCRPPWRCSARSCVPDLADDERRWLILDADAVLGLDLERVWDASAERRLGRHAGRGHGTRRERAPPPATRRDWARADALRAELETLGWDVIDTPDGPELAPHGPAVERLG